MIKWIISFLLMLLAIWKGTSREAKQRMLDAIDVFVDKLEEFLREYYRRRYGTDG
jgi:hypothetical protein